MIYQGLLSLVKSNSGIGFVNCDQGHPAYAAGRQGTVNYATFGDAPEQNVLFQMMHTLSVSLSEAELDNTSEISDYITRLTSEYDISFVDYDEWSEFTAQSPQYRGYCGWDSDFLLSACPKFKAQIVAKVRSQE